MFKVLLFVYLTTNIFSVQSYLDLNWETNYPAFDPNFYEDALDSELCQQQLEYIRNDTLLVLQFLESGLRVPRGILTGNLYDFGNYFECLGISQDIENTNIEGKYCSISVPVNQNLLPEFSAVPDIPDGIDFDPRKLKVKDETLKNLKKFHKIAAGMNGLIGIDINSRSVDVAQIEGVEFSLAVCVPKPCTTQEGISGLLFNLSAIGFEYRENFCRLNNDKPWTPADYVSVIIFSLIGLLTLLSTSYDLWHTYLLKSDSKSISTICRSFSVYTNCRRLTTFTTIPDALECLDGIRAFSMMWVIVGHTFSTLPFSVNTLEYLRWAISFEALWLTTAPIAVDTFFTIGGMLLVYSMVGKLSGMKLLKNLHVFYLHRLLRMFPLLAAAVLIQASFLYRLSDGPFWNTAASLTERCRNYWWSTLLYIQNYTNTEIMCLPHSWYLAIDMQLHIISPLVLFWVLSGSKKAAWISISAVLLTFLVASTTYIFIMEFPGAVIASTLGDQYMYYMVYYYLNTLTRASPFFIGMLFGYLLHSCRGKKVKITKMTNIALWICACVLTSLTIYSSYPMMDSEWDNQVVDGLVNSFSRPMWAVGIGWLVFACVHGYGGPINWFLSHPIWKLPSRLSYGMYLFHYPIMYITAGSALQPIYFTPVRAVYRFLCEFSIAFMVSFVMTLVIDSPFSTIVKLLLGGGIKKPSNIQRSNGMSNENNVTNNLPYNKMNNEKLTKL